MELKPQWERPVARGEDGDLQARNARMPWSDEAIPITIRINRRIILIDRNGGYGSRRRRALGLGTVGVAGIHLGRCRAGRIRLALRRGCRVAVGGARIRRGSDLVDVHLDWLADEAVETSAIEGESLRRDSVRASLLHFLGLVPALHAPPAERASRSSRLAYTTRSASR